MDTVVRDWWSKNIKFKMTYADDIVLTATTQELRELVDPQTQRVRIHFGDQCSVTILVYRL